MAPKNDTKKWYTDFGTVFSTTFSTVFGNAFGTVFECITVVQKAVQKVVSNMVPKRYKKVPLCYYRDMLISKHAHTCTYTVFSDRINPVCLRQATIFYMDYGTVHSIILLTGGQRCCFAGPFIELF